jgi:hypothetical protein
MVQISAVAPHRSLPSPWLLGQHAPITSAPTSTPASPLDPPISAIAAGIAAAIPAAQVRLFGSRARGTSRPASPGSLHRKRGVQCQQFQRAVTSLVYQAGILVNG